MLTFFFNRNLNVVKDEAQRENSVPGRCRVVFRALLLHADGFGTGEGESADGGLFIARSAVGLGTAAISGCTAHDPRYPRAPITAGVIVSDNRSIGLFLFYYYIYQPES